MKGSDRNKLILVVVLFVLAGLVIAYQMNWIPGLGGAGAGSPAPRAGTTGTPTPSATGDGTTEPSTGSHRTPPPK